MSMLKDWINGMLGRETSRKAPEIGRGEDGEMSVDALKKWLLWSVVALGICLAAVSAMAAVSAVRNRKEAAVLEVDSGAVLELYLNRKGEILKSKGDATEMLKDYSLEEGTEKILQGLSDHGELGDGEAVIFTLRPSATGISADLDRFADEIHVYAEAFLRKKHSNGTVYVSVLEGEMASGELATDYGVSLGKAALVKDLVDENASIREADMDRLLKMPLDDLFAEISGRKYDTSFIVVIAKQVYSVMVETEAAPEETTAAVETEAEETEPVTTAPTTAATTAAETEAPETVEESSSEAEGELAESEEGSAETMEESSAEGETNAMEETVSEETSAAAEETTAAPVEAETQPAVEETQPETAAPAPTEAPTVPETQAPETAAPETSAPESTQPAGSIIEQVVPLTPQA